MRPPPAPLSAGAVLAFLLSPAGSGCAAAPPADAPSAPAVGARGPGTDGEGTGAREARLEALPARTLLLRSDPESEITPEAVLQGFLSGLDRLAIRRRGPGEILIGFRTYPVLLRWKAAPPEVARGEGGIFVEATAPEGFGPDVAAGLVTGLRTWAELHGLHGERGPVTGVRVTPGLDAGQDLGREADAVLRDLGRVPGSPAWRGMGCGAATWGVPGRDPDWFVWDAHGSDADPVEIEVMRPGTPFAAEEERNLLLRILLRLLPGREEEVRSLLR